MTILRSKEARDYLEGLAEELAISDARYEQAEASYHSLGQWLDRPSSTIARYKPSVYVQGSFGLGTVIKPLTPDEEYDIDSVCELTNLAKTSFSQEQLKRLVGAEVEEYRKSKGMVKPLKESRRCWTLRYADGAQFHMDIVPAVPNGAAVRALFERNNINTSLANSAIAITDNEHHLYRQRTDEWPRSNPKGYLEWFKGRIRVILNERKLELAKSINASVEQIPDYRVRTPLQSAIMILKHHRDVMFQRDTTNCGPISIIITTLAAHAYNGEAEVAEALLSILARMDQYILKDQHGRERIPNPSDPLENFADKWEKHPERKQAFYRWLRQAQADFAGAANLTSGSLITETLAPNIGVELAKRAQTRVGRGGLGASMLRGATAATSAVAAPAFGAVPRVPSKPKGFG